MSKPRITFHSGTGWVCGLRYGPALAWEQHTMAGGSVVQSFKLWADYRRLRGIA